MVWTVEKNIFTIQQVAIHIFFSNSKHLPEKKTFKILKPLAGLRPRLIMPSIYDAF